MQWLVLACPDCPTGVSARAWAAADLWPTLPLVLLPLFIAVGGVAAFSLWRTP